MGKSLYNTPYVIRHHSNKTKPQIFIIDKIKKPKKVVKRISKTGSWSGVEKIQLAVLTYMNTKLNHSWRNLYEFIPTRNIKQIRNKKKQDLKTLKKICNKFENFLQQDINLNDQNRYQVYKSLCLEMKRYMKNLSDCDKDSLDKLFSTAVYCFNIDRDEIEMGILPKLEMANCKNFFDGIENISIQISKEDYQIFQTLKEIHNIPILDYSNIQDFMLKKYDLNK